MSDDLDIYDADSLSSDEYSRGEEEEDALMNAAITSKQPNPKPSLQTSSENTSPAKSTSTSTTGASSSNLPRNLVLDSDQRRFIKDLPQARQLAKNQRKSVKHFSGLHIQYKRRSLHWLYRFERNRISYLKQLKLIVPSRKLIIARKISDQMRLLQQVEEAQRSHSHSPELICLDDTENEESPEKTKAPNENSALLRRQASADDEPRDLTEEKLPIAQNGSVLEEFLKLKSNVLYDEQVVETPTEKGEVEVAYDIMPNNELEMMRSITSTYIAFSKAKEAQLQAQLAEAQPQLTPSCSPAKPLQQQEHQVPTMEQSQQLQLNEMLTTPIALKRRRSNTPPANTYNSPPAEPVYSNEKRTKHSSANESDDDIIEVTPNELPAAKQPATPEPSHSQSPQRTIAAVADTTMSNAPGASLETTASIISSAPTLYDMPVASGQAVSVPTFKLGPAFSLTSANNANNEFFTMEPQPTQLTQVLSTLPSNIVVPFTPSEPMDVSYSNEKAQLTSSVPASICNTNDKYSVSKIKTQPQPAMAAPNQPVQQANPPAFGQEAATVPIFAKPPSVYGTSQQQVSKPRAEHISRQTQTTQSPAEAPTLPPQQQSQQLPQQQSQQPPPTVGGSKKAAVSDLNNSDATFHQRLKDTYSQLDEIMTEKMLAVKPELKAYSEEKVRIEADMKTLDSLIAQKEEECNRLLHLRYMKEELYARIERKERFVIMKEILPPILNKNCSTAELYEMHALLVDEQNSPIKSRFGVSAIEYFINKMERSQDDIQTLRSAMGMLDTSRQWDRSRRNSLPMAREQHQPPPPPAAAERTAAAFGRQGAVRDVRSLIEDFRREHPEEQPLVGKRARLPTSQSFSDLLSNSTPNLASTSKAAASGIYNSSAVQTPQGNSHRKNHNLLENYIDADTNSLQPLYNSSPVINSSNYHRNQTRQALNEIGAGHENMVYRSNSDVETDLYNSGSYRRSSLGQTRRELIDQLHAMSDRPRELHEMMEAQRGNPVASSHPSVSVNHSGGGGKANNARLLNGPDESTRRCQQCLRLEATYMCAACQNQWYCSRECQILAWDYGHWKTCGD